MSVAASGHTINSGTVRGANTGQGRFSSGAQSARAHNPRPNRKDFDNVGGANHPAAHPNKAKSYWQFGMVHCWQSIKHAELPVLGECDERKYFTDLVVQALMLAREHFNDNGWALPNVLDSVLKALDFEARNPHGDTTKVLSLHNIEVPQLTSVNEQHVNIAERDPERLDDNDFPATDTRYMPNQWESYMATMANGRKGTYAQSPKEEVRGGSGSLCSYATNAAAHDTQPSHCPHAFLSHPALVARTASYRRHDHAYHFSNARSVLPLPTHTPLRKRHSASSSVALLFLSLSSLANLFLHHCLVCP